jgi:hypothetical protein
MAKYETRLTGNFDQLVNRLSEEIMGSAASMNLVDQTDYQLGDMKIAVRVYDKYYMRNGNRTSLNVTMVGHGEELFLTAIGSGGGQGVLFNSSWGAEEDIVDLVQSIVGQLG